MFRIKRTTRDWVVCRIGGKYEQHAHFRSKKGALKCIELIEKREFPTSEYFIGSVQRLLTIDEISKLTVHHKKEKYINRR